MKILVTGGAGYIGSHTVKFLKNSGHEVIVYDNLSSGRRDFVGCKFVLGDIKDRELLEKTFKENEIEAVIHFAGFICVGESMSNPSKYFENNIANGIKLLNTMIKCNIKKIVFSSSAAVYKAKDGPLSEDDETKPVSFYGESKLMFEKLLGWYDKIHGIKSICLRYFNAAGAGYNLGEIHNPETHLIPLILTRDNISIFGTDYPTKDGTCIRDYIHVLDLALAHKLAVEKLSGESKIYNVGLNEGYSVKEIIQICREISSREILVKEGPRREGDPAVLVADSSRIKEELDWQPQFGIRDIISSAWQWHKVYK